MSKSEIIIEIILLFFALAFSLHIWNWEISIETNFIPTILNGVTSGISIIVGFILTALAIVFSGQHFKPLQSKSHILAILTLLVIPFFMLFGAYMELLVYAEYVRALKWAMISLIVSFFIFADFLIFLIGRIETMKQD